VVAPSGATVSVTLSTQPAGTWTAVSNASWIAISSASSGTGSATVRVAVAANIGAERVGTATIADSTFTVTQQAATGACVEDGDTVCLQDNRFKVEVMWQDFQGRTGWAHSAPVSSTDSALLWFFESQNWEMLVKVVNGCGVNGHYWFFSAAATNVSYHIEVTDTSTGQRKTYDNPLGTLAPATADTSAFASCP
jgi:hypothetical protein